MTHNCSCSFSVRVVSGPRFVSLIKEKRNEAASHLSESPLSRLRHSGHRAKVTTDYDKSTNFQVYKTYAWGKGTPAKNQIWDERIRDGVDQRLAAKGFQKVDMSANPDLVVLYHGAVGSQTQLNTMDTGGYGWGYRWGGGMSTTTVQQIPTGQLSVDIGDAKTKKLLWVGSSSNTLSDNPDKNQKLLNKVLDKMFQKFPPPQGK